MELGCKEYRRAAVNGVLVLRVLVCFRGILLFRGDCLYYYIFFECMAVSVLASLVCLPEGPVVILYT